MTLESFHILTLYEVREILFQHLEQNPAEFALSFRNSPYPTHLLATQLKYLQRAKEKLPTFYEVAAIIPPLSYEQCSSEKAAESKNLRGKTCLDLTCGLGIDSLYFSKQFEKVTAIEKDFVLSEITKYNFHLLNINNLEIINTSAEDFLQNYEGEAFEVIYLDPSRRDDKGGKVFLPQDCSPNLREILPILHQKGKKIVVKFSPLYDISAAQKDFPAISAIQVLSIENECKEMVLIFEEKKKPFEVEIVCCRKNAFFRFYFTQMNADLTADSRRKEKITLAYLLLVPAFFLYEPDVAFYKARLTTALFSTYYADCQGFLSHETGFFFSTEKITDFVGRTFQVLEVWEYQPKKIKALLAKKKTYQANIIQRNFPFSVENIRKSLSLKEGGTYCMICTQIEGATYVFYGERIS